MSDVLEETFAKHRQWGRVHNLKEFLLTKNVYGMIAGSAMIIVVASVVLLKKRQYETFHIVHSQSNPSYITLSFFTS